MEITKETPQLTVSILDSVKDPRDIHILDAITSSNVISHSRSIIKDKNFDGLTEPGDWEEGSSVTESYAKSEIEETETESDDVNIEIDIEGSTKVTIINLPKETYRPKLAKDEDVPNTICNSVRSLRRTSCPKLFFGYLFCNFVLVVAIMVPYYYHTRNSILEDATCNLLSCSQFGTPCDTSSSISSGICTTLYANISLVTEDEIYTVYSWCQYGNDQNICNTTSTIGCYYDRSNIGGSLTLNSEDVDALYSDSEGTSPEAFLGIMIGTVGTFANFLASVIETVVTLICIGRSIGSIND